MNDMLCRSWWMPALRGVFAIAFAILALGWPGLTLLGLVALFAAYALLSGIASVVAAMRHRKSHEDWWLPLLLGIAGIAAGMIAVFHPGLTIVVLVLLIGANALVSGVLDLAMAIRLRKSIQHEWLLVLSAVECSCASILVFLFPGAGALALVWMISIYALISGALLLALAFRLHAIQAGRGRGGFDRRVLPDRRRAPPAQPAH